MTSATAFLDNVALLLLQNLKEGMETGRVADLNAVRTEVDAAMAELDRRYLPEEPTRINDLFKKLSVEIGSLHEKVAKCEAQLAEFQCQTKAIKEDATQIVARTEACNLLVEQQQKENVKVPVAMEEGKASMSTPAPSPAGPIPRTAPSAVAIVSFPGGPRTITIHPPDSPGYRSTIRDEKGDVIIDFRRTKPLRREGAFRGPLEKVDWSQIKRVCGREPDLPGARAPPPVPVWPDRSQPSSCPPPSCGPSDLIARQRQLSTSMQTDASGRVLAPDYHKNANSPSLSTGTSSAQESSQDAKSCLSAKPDVLSTPTSTPLPPSPSLRRGKKRTRNSELEDGEDVALTAETCEGASQPVDLRSVEEPVTPTPVKRGEPLSLEGPAKRKKLCSSTSVEGSSIGSPRLSRTRSMLDLTYTT